MDPLTLGVSAVGLGLQMFGAFGAANNSAQQAGISRNIAADEQRISQQKQMQMQLQANRMSIENFRNAQRMRAQATAAAVNQGANFGSGLQGGLAGITDQSNWNQEGISQNLQFGNTIFGINNDISSQKMQLASIQSDQAKNQAWEGLGGTLVKDAGTIGNIGKTVFKW